MSLSKTASAIKTAHLYFSFQPSSYQKKQYKIHHLFSTKSDSKLSLGSQLLITFDYARHFEIIKQTIDFSMFDGMNWLPGTIKDALKYISDDEKPKEQINKFVFYYFRFNNTYQSFLKSTGTMKKIERLPNSFEKQENFEKNKEWLDREKRDIEHGFDNIFENSYWQHKNLIEKEDPKSNLYNDLIVEIDDAIPEYMQSIMRMFLKKYASIYHYNQKKIHIRPKRLKECNFGQSTFDDSGWYIFLCEKGINENSLQFYFVLLNTIFHELGHLIRRDPFEPTNLTKIQMKRLKVHKEWHANQVLALQDKEIAEIIWVCSLFFELSIEAGSAAHPSGSSSVLRCFDIAQHYNLIPHDVIQGKRDLQINDIEPILIKHGFSEENLKNEFFLKCIQNVSQFYQTHKYDQKYESLVSPHQHNEQTTKKLRISYPRNVSFD